MYRCVFIDLDDTLWDFKSNSKDVLNEIYHQMSLGQYFDTFENYYSLYAVRNKELWDLYSKGVVTKEYLNHERFNHPFAQIGVHNEVLAQSINQQYFKMLPFRTTLMPHTIEVLEYLYRKYTLTIVSNGFEELQYNKIKSASIEKYFSHIVLSQTANALKPNPLIFEYALSLNNASVHETVMIGDNYLADICGARNAGMDQIYYNPQAALPLDQIAPTFSINSLLELKDIL